LTGAFPLAVENKTVEGDAEAEDSPEGTAVAAGTVELASDGTADGAAGTDATACYQDISIAYG
jgi:hypothetical protein